MADSWSDVATAFRQGLPLGIVGGFASFLVSLGVFVALLWVDGTNVIQRGALRAAGKLLYNAHFVDVAVSGGGEPISTDLLALAGGSLSVPLVVFYLVPAFVLGITGFALAYRGASDAVASHAATGATVLAGYVLAVVAGVVLFATTGVHGVARPDPIASILIAGLVYPGFVGAVGGAIATFVK